MLTKKQICIKQSFRMVKRRFCFFDSLDPMRMRKSCGYSIDSYLHNFVFLRFLPKALPFDLFSFGKKVYI